MARRYFSFDYPYSSKEGITFLTGIRSACDGKAVHISASYKSASGPLHGLYYVGDLCEKGKWYKLDYPDGRCRRVTDTSLYGPNPLKEGKIQVVGSYKTEETGAQALGCLYEGDVKGNGCWTTIQPPWKHVINTICHSVNGGLLVGNYDTKLVQGKSFLYDIERKKYYKIKIPEALSSTAYGILYEGCDQYIICGGLLREEKKELAYTLRFDRKKWQLYDLQTYSYKDSAMKYPATHFNGISADGKGGYSLTGDGADHCKQPFAFYLRLRKNGEAEWSEVAVPGAQETSGNSVDQKVVIGVFKGEDDKIGAYVSY